MPFCLAKTSSEKNKVFLDLRTSVQKFRAIPAVGKCRSEEKNTRKKADGENT